MAQFAIAKQADRPVHVNRLQLLEILRRNRSAHRVAYAEAVEGYREQALAKLEEAVKKARSKLTKRHAELKTRLSNFDPAADEYDDYLELVGSIGVQLPVPRDYSYEYDTAIAIAEHDVRDVLELSGAEFQCFVLDKWTWTVDFFKVSANYLKKR